MLKIEPYAAWLMQQSDKYDRVVSYVGIRADKQGVVSSETPSDYTQNYLCKADYTQSVDVEAIAEIYEREREKYLGGTGDYYPNNKAAFEGCMQKALSQSGLLGGWRDIESLEEKDGEVLLSGHEFNKESKPRWYATGFKNIVGEVLAYDEDGASNASYADKWMPIPPAKEGGC